MLKIFVDLIVWMLYKCGAELPYTVAFIWLGSAVWYITCYYAINNSELAVIIQALGLLFILGLPNIEEQ
jgi:hypothetical protein